MGLSEGFNVAWAEVTACQESEQHAYSWRNLLKKHLALNSQFDMTLIQNPLFKCHGDFTQVAS